jgi:lycopene beta-cyclase
MHSQYDIILVGRGLANLLFAVQYLQKNKKLKILIIEKQKIIPKRYISTWQGPGLIDLKKEFGLKKEKSWKKISVSNDKEYIVRKTAPYEYVSYEYSKNIRILLSRVLKYNVDIIYQNVKSITELQDYIEIETTKDSFKAKFVMNSMINENKKEIDPHMLHQYFVGTEIKPNTSDRIDECQLMHFTKVRNAIQFNYILPFAKNRILIETTEFSKKIDFKKLERINNQLIKKSKINFKEMGVIPMSTKLKFQRTKRVIPTGIGGGFARPSSGYLLIRTAMWAKENKDKHLSEILFSQKKVINFLDKIFLRACANSSEDAQKIFMALFKAKNIHSVIRFLADSATIKDLINIIIISPKKIMINALFK